MNLAQNSPLTIQRSGISSNRPDGFTLIELLTVIAIVSLLVQLLIPAVLASREGARRTQCANNLRQIGLATQQFHDSHGKYPPGRWRSSSPTWFVLLLPYLEAQDAHDLWSLDAKYYDAVNEQARQVAIPLWKCPSQKSRPAEFNAEDREDAQGAVGDYAGNYGSFFSYFFDPTANGIITTSSMWEKSQGPASKWLRKPWDSDIRMAMVTDGTSNTILAGEKAIPAENVGTFPDDSSLYNGNHPHAFCRAGGPGFPIWSKEYICRGGIGCEQFGSSHPQICQFVFLDGSVHVVKNDISMAILGRLCDRADGQSVEIGPD